MPSTVSGGLPTSMLLAPPLPLSPWHWLQPLSTSSLAPSLAVPLPGGKLLPSGSTLMSQGLMSASLTGLPRCGLSAANAPEAKASATRRATARGLNIDMLDLSGARNPPCGEAVVVLVGKAEHVGHFLGFAAHGNKIGAQRLHGAGIVPGAAGDDGRLAVPAPRHGEARERPRADRAFYRRFAPTLAAVGGDQNFLDASGARIGDAGNLVKARALHGVAERGLGNERFHLVDEIELVGLAVGQQRRI